MLRILTILVVATVVTPESNFVGCKFEVDANTQFWLQGNSRLPPVNQPRTEFEVKAGSFFSAGCKGKTGRVTTRTEFQCLEGNVVRTRDGVIGRFQELFRCRRVRPTAPIDDAPYKETVFRNGTCYNGFTNIVIELRSSRHSYVVATVCHNERTSETLFTKSIIRGADLDKSESIDRPSFKEAGFYPDISADDCYKKVGQFETVAELLGSEQLARDFIPAEGEYFLSRGHLWPNADGIEGFEKAATFYFVNVVGQWQIINGGNWQRLEERARQIAEQRHSTLTVYTGGYGVMTLPDVNNNNVEIWLGRHNSGYLIKKLPVPKLTWKILHDERTREAAVVIMLNNPWFEPTDIDILCPDICDKLPWVTWDTTNIVRGFTYCCSVGDFYKAVPFAPNLGNLPLLNESI